MKKFTLLTAAALISAFSASALDNIVVTAGETVTIFGGDYIPETKTWTFDDGTLEGWTTIDADGDGFDWFNTVDGWSDKKGRNGTNCLASASYDQPSYTALSPDNYLVAPIRIMGTGSTRLTFYASSLDDKYPEEHFGVAVSTTGNTNPSDFTTIVEWTFGEAVGLVASKDKVKRNIVRRAQAEWVEYSVDLGDYAGKIIWVALRHFGCEDQYYLEIDDITLSKYVTNFYTWTNDNPAIGLYEKGGGKCTFIALNDASGEDMVANITATSVSQEVSNFTITVKPMNAEVSPVEDINVKDGEAVKVPLDYLSSLVYDFNDKTLNGWTTIDADGDGYNWTNSFSKTTYVEPVLGKDGSYCIISKCYGVGGSGAQTPDNYLVTPLKIKATASSYIEFIASVYDNNREEHFGVAVSTTGNSNAADFKTIAEWTFDDEVGFASPAMEKAERSDVRRVQTKEWVTYHVDLSEYDGKEIWVALRHFNTKDQDEHYLFVDDVRIGGVNLEDVGCVWTNDNPSIGLAESGTGDINFDVVNKTEKEQVAKITVNACKDVEGGRVYGQPMKFKVVVAANESGIDEITADDNTEAVFYTVSGIQVPADRLLPGIYLRRTASGVAKVIVK